MRQATVWLTFLLLLASLTAQERKPSDSAARGKRPANPGAPRGERPASTERNAGASGARTEFPAGLKLTDELGPKLANLTEQHSRTLTAERRAARDAAIKEARESGKDRQAASDAIAAALKMTDAEKAQLAELDESLRDLRRQIRDRIVALLTAEQQTGLEKRFGAGRPRN